MWAFFHELCADAFGLTKKGRALASALLIVGTLLVGLVLTVERGPIGLIGAVALVVIALVAARQVTAARAALWRAACLSLDHPWQKPSTLLPGGGPTEQSLRQLAAALDAVRRADFATAQSAIACVERPLLLEEEAQLLDAAHAMISLGLGESERAAQRAVVALPTGSEDLDTSLGRTMIASAWRDAVRLRAIDGAWGRAGIGRDDVEPLGRLRRLVRVRLDPNQMDTLGREDAKALSDEARAVGDDELAAELESRARPTAYR